MTLRKLNINSILLFVFPLLISANGYAGSSLKETCSDYGGTLITDVQIKNYNYSTTTNFFNVRTSYSTDLWLGTQKQLSSFLYDMAKTARLTGEPVDVCYNPSGGYLLGIEWTRPIP